MSSGPVRYDALIVDPDIDTRMRLKSATTSVVQFGKVTLLNNLRETKSRIEAGGHIDIMFISSRFERSDVTQFITFAKNAAASQDAAFVLILETGEQDSSTIAENVMLGVDGFLFEPYSVDQLVEITALAARVKKERATERETAALQFLLTDVMHQLNMIAYLKSVGYDVGRGIKRFKQMCKVIQALDEKSLPNYFKLAVDMFEKAEFPKMIYQKSYSGASKRVREKMEKKLLEEIEKDLKDDGEKSDSAPAEEAST